MKKHPRLQDRLNSDTILKFHYGEDDVDEPRFITGYWSIRGLGAPIRMMLSAAEVNHWVVLYDVTEDGTDGWSKETWLKDKEWIKQGYNCLANLPYLIDCQNNMILCQSNAILSYLGRQLRMLGKTPPLTCRCEELLCEIMDLRNYMVRYAYSKNIEDSKEDAEKLIQGPAGRVLDKLENYLIGVYPNGAGESHPNPTYDNVCHLVGNSFSAPDFCLWEMLDQYQALGEYFNLPQVLKDRPYLEAFLINFSELSENRPFLDCGAVHAQLPFNNPYARFGSDSETKGPYQRGQQAFWRKQGIIVEKRTRTRPIKRPRLS